MSYTFDQLKKRVGKYLKRYDDTNGWKASNTDVTEDDVEEFINETYLEELAPLFINKFPENFRTKARTNSWIATGTVDVSSTSTTLVATSSIFTSSMVGLKIWNDTDEELAEITDYTDASTLTLDTAIGNTWDGDTIYVLGKEFSFGGDASDLYQLESIGIKYSTSSQYYQKATLIDEPTLFRQGWEEGSEASPYVYLTTLSVNGSLLSGVGISPKFSKKVTDAIEISALVRPPALSADGDIPRLPVANALIAGAVMKGFEMKQEFEKAAIWAQKYQKATFESVARYAPMKVKYGTGIRPNRRINAMMSRRI